LGAYGWVALATLGTRHRCPVACRSSLLPIVRASSAISARPAVDTGEADPGRTCAPTQSQQRKFTCEACEEYNDILGRFSYCSTCGTRNDLRDFKTDTVPAIRTELNNGGVPEDAVKSIVSAFDTFVGQYAKQLAALVPMTNRRFNRLTKQRFQDLTDVQDLFRDWLDIVLCDGVSAADEQFARRMFMRRHVYEHNGGEVDQQYLDKSGDTTVRLKQHIRETREDAHRLIGLVNKIATNLHNGFHQLLPPRAAPIKAFAEKKARIEQYRQRN
jgi:hypothetical protein